MIGAWLKERCPLVLITPWVGFLAAPALLRGADPFATLGLVLLIVIGARLLDDLADRDVDRAEAPERVLVRAERLQPFVALCGALALGSVALAALRGPVFALAAAGLWLALTGWYAIRPRARRRLNAAVVLLKYPAIVALTLPTLDPLPLVGVGLAFLAYELLHDERLGAEPLGWTLAGVLIVGCVLDPAELGDWPTAAALLVGLAVLPVARARPFAPFPLALPWIGLT